MREIILIFCVGILFCQNIAGEDVEISDQRKAIQMLENEDMNNGVAVLEIMDIESEPKIVSAEDHKDNIDVLDNEAAKVQASQERVARTIYPAPFIYPAPLYYPRPYYGGFRRRGYGGFYRRRGFYGRRRRRFGFYG